MLNEDWQNVVNSLVDAKRSLANAWQILDGTDGAAPGVEHAFGAAVDSIDAVYAIESTNPFNEDAAAPAEVQTFWEQHGALPGFAFGT